MYFISHRGNLSGPDIKNENKIDYISHAINSGFDVEVDIYYYKNKFYLGHDEPSYLTSLNFLENKKFGVTQKIWMLWRHYIKLSVIIFGIRMTM